MATILLAGGAGYIGSHTAAELLDAGAVVHGRRDSRRQIRFPPRRRCLCRANRKPEGLTLNV